MSTCSFIICTVVRWMYSRMSQMAPDARFNCKMRNLILLLSVGCAYIFYGAFENNHSIAIIRCLLSIAIIARFNWLDLNLSVFAMTLKAILNLFRLSWTFFFFNEKLARKFCEEKNQLKIVRCVPPSNWFFINDLIPYKKVNFQENYGEVNKTWSQ